VEKAFFLSTIIITHHARRAAGDDDFQFNLGSFPEAIARKKKR